MGIRCFLLTPTETAWRWLRRHAPGDCPLQPETKPEHRYHCAMARIEDGEARAERRGYAGTAGGERDVSTTSPSEWPRDDPRWPTRCGCGFAFPEAAARQLFWQVAYRDEAGKLWSIHSSELPGVDRAPPGAMWYADWWPAPEAPGGRALVVRCPATPDGGGVSDWMPDGPSTTHSAPAWRRQGTPPNVTATPSVFVRQPHGWHGFLTAGELKGVPGHAGCD